MIQTLVQFSLIAAFLRFASAWLPARMSSFIAWQIPYLFILLLNEISKPFKYLIFERKITGQIRDTVV